MGTSSSTLAVASIGRARLPQNRHFETPAVMDPIIDGSIDEDGTQQNLGHIVDGIVKNCGHADDTADAQEACLLEKAPYATGVSWDFPLSRPEKIHLLSLCRLSELGHYEADANPLV